MPYIGKTPTVGNFQVCDAISVVNGQAAYTLQVGGVNVAPESANHMLVSLNGILQKPGSSFTISGSTMTFASNLATGDVIDFVQILGNVLDLGQPSDDTVKTASIQANAVTGAKLNNDVISAQTALTDSPADTDELLISDAGTIKRIDVSLVGGKNTPMFLAYQSSNQTIATVTTTRVVFDTEEFDDDNVFTNTSGNYKFTVPSAGKYWIYVSVSKNSFSGNAFEVFLKRTRSSVETMAMNCGAGGNGDSEEVAGNGKIFECQVGDEFHVTAKHEDSGSRSIFGGLNYTFFGAYKIIE